MIKEFNAKALRKEYHIWGYLGKRFSLFLSKKVHNLLGFCRGKDKTIFFAFLWLAAIYIPKETYDAYNRELSR